MKTLKQTWMMAAVIVGLVIPQLQLQAQTATKPMAVVAINNYNDLSKDLSYLLELVGPPGTAQILEQQGAGFAQMLDTSKPIGVIVESDGILGAKLLGFIPTNDVDQILQLLAGFGFLSQPTSDGLIEVDAAGVPIYIKKGTGWAFISNMKETLATTPADPVASLGGLDKQYDVAIKGNIDAIPEVFKQLMMSQIQVGLQQSLQQPLPGETEDAFEARRAVAMQSIEDMQKMVNELESMTVGFNIDQTRQSVYVDFGITAKEGTDTAKQFDYSGTTTDLAGFISEDAAIQLNVASTFDTSQAEQASISLEALRAQAIEQIRNDQAVPSEELRALAIKAISTFFDVGNATLKTGKIDMAGNVEMSSSNFTVVAGAFVPQAEQLDEIVREFVKIASEQDPSFPEVEIDALKFGDASFHLMKIPVPEFEEEARAIFGDTIEITIGMGADRLYLGAGTGNLDRIKAAIEKSAANKGKEVPAALLVGSVSKVLMFGAEQTQDLVLQQAAAAAASVAGKDKARAEVTPIKGGARYRLELEAGVLKALAVGFAAAQAEAGLDDSPF
ncbi:MAG: hypothetical protein VX738_07735 [Planctomycetota bacterium]|nr:hypothetical protein [Planctomycetota bacterium]